MPKIPMSRKASVLVDLLLQTVKPTHFEYQFMAERKWRFDWAWPQAHVAVEWEGGAWTGGRHTQGKGYSEDCKKYNTAESLGWHVLRVPYRLLIDEYTWVEGVIQATLVRAQSQSAGVRF